VNTKRIFPSPESIEVRKLKKLVKDRVTQEITPIGQIFDDKLIKSQFSQTALFVAPMAEEASELKTNQSSSSKHVAFHFCDQERSCFSTITCSFTKWRSTKEKKRKQTLFKKESILRLQHLKMSRST
jgi:hypothetical protein